MKIKNLLILTLFISFNYSVYSEDKKDEQKDELNEVKSDSEYEQFFHRQEGLVYKKAEYKKNFSHPKKVLYSGAFTIKISNKKNVYLELTSIYTKKAVAFIGDFKLDYRSVYVFNNKLAYVRWKTKVYDSNMNHVGYCERVLIRSKAGHSDNLVSKVTKFLDLKNNKIGYLYMMLHKTHKKPLFVRKKINGVIIPQITQEIYGKYSGYPHYYTGLIIKQPIK